MVTTEASAPELFERRGPWVCVMIETAAGQPYRCSWERATSLRRRCGRKWQRKSPDEWDTTLPVGA